MIVAETSAVTETDLRASVAPQPALGHPLIAQLGSTYALVNQVYPVAKGGQVG